MFSLKIYNFLECIQKGVRIKKYSTLQSSIVHPAQIHPRSYTQTTNAEPKVYKRLEKEIVEVQGKLVHFKVQNLVQNIEILKIILT